MYIQATPIKQNNSFEENEFYSADFTSGKKLRGVSQNVFSTNRLYLPNKKNYMPFVKIMDVRSEQQTEANLDNSMTNNYFSQEQEIDRLCQQKENLMQNKMMTQQVKQQIADRLKRLHDATFGHEATKHNLIHLKKSNLRNSHQLELQKEKIQSQVEDTRELIKTLEQGMYHKNRLIFKSEKEKQQIKAQIIKSVVKTQEVEQAIQAGEKNQSSLLAEEAKLGQNYQQKKEVYDDNTQINEYDMLQVSILKMQINPHLRAGFEAIHGDQSAKKKILEKNPNIWQRKNKLLSKSEIKYYILIQLYPCWKRMLDMLSYNCTGWKQIFFRQHLLLETEKIIGLDEYIFTKEYRKDAKKYIVFYSPLQESYDQLLSVLFQLKGLDNGIIRIHDVVLQKQVNEEITIHFDFRNQKKMKTFEIVRLKELTKQAINPFLRSTTVLMKIEIPFCLDYGEKLRMEEIYRLIFRQK